MNFVVALQLSVRGTYIEIEVSAFFTNQTNGMNAQYDDAGEIPIQEINETEMEGKKMLSEL